MFNAFSGCTGLKNITIPSSAIYIMSDAFSGCSSLKSITIPEGIEYINAFNDCKNLESVIIPSSARVFGFHNCPKLKNIMVAEDNVNYSAENGVLYNKDKTELIAWPSASGNIKIAEGITKIGRSTFEGCSALASITIPSSISYIEDGVFTGCENLKSITVSKNNPDFFAENGILYYCEEAEDSNENKTILVAWPSASGNVTIPSTASIIGDYAFSDNSALTGITIPEEITHIENKAFQNCANLKSITVSENNPKYFAENGILYYCEEERELIAWPSASGNVTIPSTASIIGDYAFSDNSALTGVTIPEGITSIKSGAFQYCKNLKSITIPSSMSYISCIGYGVFTGCENLKSITVSENNSDYFAEDGILYHHYKDYYGSKIVLLAWPSANGDIQIPSIVEVIGNSAFQGCGALTGVTIPNGVKEIHRSFVASNLTSIEIPRSVTSITNFAFGNCMNLKKVLYNGTKYEWGKKVKLDSSVFPKKQMQITCSDGTAIVE